MLILHGYLLEGSGSNLWTRAIIQTFCKQGKNIHLMCQEPHPETFDFISEVWTYPHDREDPVLKMSRSTPYPGKCIMHKPYIGKILPVYIWDRYEEYQDDQVIPMVDLTDKQLNYYLSTNEKAINRILENNSIGIMHANHAVLMSVVASRAAEKNNLPFVIMPHGSAIEYAVKKDPRMYDLAEEAFNKASRIFSISLEIQERVNKLFTRISNIDKKFELLNLGVDTSLFKPIPRSQRIENIKEFNKILRVHPRGKATELRRKFEENFPDVSKDEDFLRLLKESTDYELKFPDENIEHTLLQVPWNNSNILLFVGRLIENKGFHLVLSALPFILKRFPNTYLIIVGHGPLREPMQIFLEALSRGQTDLAMKIIRWGEWIDGFSNKPLNHLVHFFNELKEKNTIEEYFKLCQDHKIESHVIFTGYLTHNYLRYLFPCTDIALFPSIVAEAGPLVFLEAMASGVFPMGIYFAGMKQSIDATDSFIPNSIQQLMKLRKEMEFTIPDIVTNITKFLSSNQSFSGELRRVAVDKFDWHSVTQKMSDTFEKLLKKKN